MRSIIGRTIFAAGDVPFLWADVVIAGALWGEWAAVVERARAGLLALEREAESEEPLVGDDEVESATDQFRYAKDLVSVDDTEKWLATWGLDAEQWLTWIRADLLKKKALEEGTPREFAEEPENGDEELESAVHAEAVCSGALSRLANQLAARVAIDRKVAAAEGGAIAAETAAPDELPPLDFEHLLPDFPPEDAAARAREIARLDCVFRGFRDRVVTPEAMTARIRAKQGDWMRITCSILRSPSEDVAREALMSIQDDGEDVAEVAEGAGAELEQGTFFLEEMDRSIGDHILAAKKGELLGPLQSGEGYAVVLVTDKVLASADDEAIRARAERSIVESEVEREVDNRITWRWGR